MKRRDKKKKKRRGGAKRGEMGKGGNLKEDGCSNEKKEGEQERWRYRKGEPRGPREPEGEGIQRNGSKSKRGKTDIATDFKERPLTSRDDTPRGK